MSVSSRALAVLLVLGCASLPTRCDPLEDSVTQEVDSQDDCIATPAEYVAAFAARAPRCVSSDLVGRVSSGASVAAAQLSDASSRLSYFFSGSDVLAKYLRIGYPQVVGLSTVQNATGLATSSSGLAFLQQVGYQMEFADVSKAYVLTVTTRQALEAAAGALQDGLPYRGGVPPLAPTWRALRAYFEFVFEAENLTLSDTALAILQATSFAQLTGCPAQCAYTDPLFPSANHTTPITVDDPAANASCTAPYPGTQQTLSSGFATSSSLCDADWNEAMLAASGLFPVRDCSREQNAAAGAGLAQLLAAAEGSPRYQAQLFRAFLMQYCVGGYYALFSGDGITYSSFGGLLTPLGTEYVSSPFVVGALQPADVATVALCISGTNNGRPAAAGSCLLPQAPVAVAAAAPAAARRLLRVRGPA